MLKIIGYLGIGGLSFFFYFILLYILNAPLHVFRTSLIVIQLSLYIWYLYWLYLAIHRFQILNNVSCKTFAVLSYFISVISILVLSTLIFGGGVLSHGYKFIKECPSYDIVSRFEPWSDKLYKYQKASYTKNETYGNDGEAACEY